jgi:TnsA endonuclease N terminal
MKYQGIFNPKNKEKYKGNVKQIVYRSFWELKFMQYLDRHHDVIEWNSEEKIIPYKSPIDGKYHRYFPDFFVKRKNKDGIVEHLLIEIKPEYQTKPPLRKGNEKRYINEVMTWGINEAKWKAAKEYCEDKKYKFIILTEKHLNIKY